ncbi:hypothetical protein DPQ33_00155 [Oceanidesulfovibrio indonesiensis]|uniref:Methyl-accepting chemotaxis protein n=1 Tax=Oceanidesulfovibrio indonesiensis TaxID=54767 RepID=A0A7M3MIN5_9BACT|nr:methyl-accepting chemotaxis protein [Oceanidesulfovibrio indonesiensis]TVM19687.1 hypothetical protein DPQ33_00155 [Oceanidesulfovibrio indonesiensis]
MKLLDRLSFARKVLLLPLVATIVFVAIFLFYGLPLFQDALVESRVASTRNLVQSAESLVDSVRKEALAQGLSESAARARAMEFVREMSYDDNNYFWINDLQGVMLMHPALPELEGRHITQAPFDTAFLEELLDKARTRGSGFVSYRWPKPGSDEPVDKISFVLHYEPWGWVIATGLYIDDITDHIATITEQTLVVLVVAIALLFVASQLLTRRLVRPLGEAQRAMDKLAQGHVDVDVSYQGKDEAGMMMASMREMIDAHRVLAEHAARLADGDLSAAVVPKSEQDVLGKALANLAESLRKQLGEVVHTMEVISRTAASLGGSVHMLASSTHQTATSINETTTSVAEVKSATRIGRDNARLLADAAKTTLATSQAGMDATRQNRRDMDSILEQIGAVRAKTEALSDKASLIEQIIEFVADISDRSQILAVNAAIEAAKAGEAGAGFEEVAREMRRLATESKDATVRTRRILLDIQDSVKETTSATRESATVVETASDELVKAENAITNLAENLAKAAQASSEIAATQEQEYSGMQQIGEAMEAIRTASRQSSEVSEKLAKESKSLDELNERLEQLLSRYRF